MIQRMLPRRLLAGPQGAILAVILASAGFLHWREADFLEILPDDVLSITNSMEIATGRLEVLWSPLEQHWAPLYRLVRLPFDLRFPESHHAFHALAVTAHLANAALLYLLAARWLGSRWGALAAAALCAWSRVGVEALIWKVSFVYALSWTFVLLGLVCLARPGRVWGLATLGSVVGAVGLFAASLFLLPGFFAVASLAESRAAARRALAVCLTAGTAGVAGWLGFAGSRLPSPASLLAGDWPGRCLGGLRDAVWASGTHLTLGLPLLPDRWMPWIVLLPPLALLWLRRDVAWRPVLGFLILTMVPLIAILTLRQSPGVWKISRYAYQPSFFWYLALGALVAALLRRVQDPRRARLVGVALGLTAAGGFFGETAAARKARDSWSAHTVTQWTFWSGWDRFFKLASEHRRQLGRPLALPYYRLQLYAVDLHQLYRLCHPFGLPGLTLAHGRAVTPEDEAEFWREVERAAPQLPGFDPRHILAHPSTPASDSRPRF